MLGMGKLLRRRSVLVATVLAIAATAAFAVVALADNPLGSGYDINGSVPDPGTSFFPDPVGSVQELGPQNGSGTKLGVIHTAVPPMLGFTDINGGVDLSGMWLDTNVATNGDVWLYFGFSRESATTGQVAFEFQQAPLPGACDFTNVSPIQNGALTPAQQALINNCNPWSGRQNGDFLVVFDTQGNSTTLNKRVFSGSSFGNPQTIPANVSAAAVAPNELTGEGAINLTASGIFPAQPTKCITFANVIAATVTGNSDSADFKDTILTDTSGVGISNCGEIRVTKDTDPEGGTGNFPYTITRADNSALRFDGSVSVPGTLTSDGDSDLVKDIKVGTNYKLAEGPLDPSWVLQSITCTKNGTSYNVVPGNATFSVDASTITECEIKNVPKPKLTLVKAVVNNSGGTAAPSAWTLTATGTGGFSGTANSAAVTGKTVNAGQQYTLSESNGPTGYATTGVWSCTTGGTFASPDKITLSNGDNVTCTITNDDVAPTLTLTKIVQNNDGGTKVPADWTLTATGSGGVSGASGSPAVTNAPVLAGVQYGLSESSVPGYSTTGVWSCTAGTFASPDKITLSLGQNVTCTITNTDNPPTLKLVKSVTNNDGGSASAADFTLSAVAASGSAVRDFTSKTASPVFHNVFGATVYNLSESGPAGYTAGAWSCDGGTQAGASISVPLGGAVTCTIVNDDNGPQLKLVKQVVNDNGGPKTAADWTLSATSTGQSASRDFSYPGNTNLFKDVFAGVGYTLAEQGPAGYTAGAWQCSGGTLVGNVVTVSLGGQATCTITNNDIAPKLHLRKIIVNDNGGTATAVGLHADGGWCWFE